MWWNYKIMAVLVSVFYYDYLFEQGIFFQTTIRSSAANPPRHTPPVHPPILETPSCRRKPSSGKAILDNVLSDPPIDTITISLDSSSGIYTTPDVTYFCTGTGDDPHYVLSRPADDDTLARLLRNDRVLFEELATQKMASMEAEEHKDYGLAPHYGTLLVKWFFSHWLSCVTATLLLLILRKARPTTALLWTQEQKHRRDFHQTQQEVVALILSKERECKEKIAEQGVSHDRQISEQEVKHKQAIDEVTARHDRAVSEVEDKVKCRTARLDSKVQQLEEQIVYKDNSHHHKQRVTRDTYLQKLRDMKEIHAEELNRLGYLPENHTEKLKEDHASELQDVKQLYEQKLSQKDTRLREAEENHKTSIETQEKEIQGKLVKKDEEIKVKVREVAVIKQEAATTIKEKDAQIKILRSELQTSDSTVQNYKTANQTATRVAQKQDNEVRSLKSRISGLEWQRDTTMNELHSSKAQSERRGELLMERNSRIEFLNRVDLQKDRKMKELKGGHKSVEKEKDEKIRKLEADYKSSKQQKDNKIRKLRAVSNFVLKRKDGRIRKLTNQRKSLNIRVKSIKESEVESEEALDIAMALHEDELKALKDEMEEQKKKHDATLADLRRNSKPSSNRASPRNSESRRGSISTPRNTDTTISRSSLSQVVSQEETAVQIPEQGGAAAPESTFQPTTVQKTTVETTPQQRTPPTRAGEGASLTTTTPEVRPAGPRHQQKGPDFLPRQLQQKQQKQTQQVRTPVKAGDGASRPVEAQQLINNDSHIDQEEDELKKMQDKPVARKLVFDKTTQQDQSPSTQLGQGTFNTASTNEVHSAGPKRLPYSSPLGAILQSIGQPSLVQDITGTGVDQPPVTIPYQKLTQDETRLGQEKRIEKTKQEEPAGTKQEEPAGTKPHLQGLIEQTANELIDPALLDAVLGPVEQSPDQHVEKLIEKPVKKSNQAFSGDLFQEMLRKQQRKVHFNSGGTEDDDETPGYADEPKHTETKTYTAEEKVKGKIGKEEPAVKEPIEETPTKLIDPALRAQSSIEKPDEKPMLRSIPPGYEDSLVEEERRRGRKQTLHKGRDGSIDDEETQKEPVKKKPVEQKLVQQNPVVQFVRTTEWVAAASTFGSGFEEERSEKAAPVASSPIKQMTRGNQIPQQKRPQEPMKETKKQDQTLLTQRDPQFKDMPVAPGREMELADAATMAKRKEAREAEKKAKKLRSPGKRP